MKTDCYFEIGNSHEQCQDFALSGFLNPNIAYAIVCDGCSESHKRTKEVDFGARILAYSAREILKEFGVLINLGLFSDPTNEIFKKIKQKAIANTISIGEKLALSQGFSDATLLIALSNGTDVKVFMFGDGGIIVKQKDGDTLYRGINFLSSAPFYLSYGQCNSRYKSYHDEFGKSPVVIGTTILDDSGEEKSTRNDQFLPVKCFDELYEMTTYTFKDVASVSVVSDGIRSYEENAVAIPERIIVPQFVAFKNTNGIFQQRRMLFMKAENQKKNISHYDDISVATIVN